MKAVLFALLVVSLGVNLWLLRRGPRAWGDRDAGGQAIASTAEVTPRRGSTAPADFSALRSDDLAELRDRLRGVGVGEDLIRAIVSTQVRARHADALKSTIAPRTTRPWWHGGVSASVQTQEQRAAARRIRQQIEDEIRTLLGEPPEDPSAASDPRYAYLSVANRRALQRLERDYEEMSADVRQDRQGSSLVGEKERLALLDQAKQSDLFALLSPTELAEYQLRFSPTAKSLRPRMTLIQATEREYRAIFDLQREFDAKWKQPRGELAAGLYEARQEAERQLTQNVKAALGEERGQQYAWSARGEYAAMNAAVRRLGLAPEVPDRVMRLRETTETRSSVIMNDPALTADARVEAWKALARETQAELQTMIPSGMREAIGPMPFSWLTHLENRAAVAPAASPKSGQPRG